MKQDSIVSDGGVTTLDEVGIGRPMTIVQVVVPAMSQEWERWLEEIGFISGEQVMVMARALPGGDPLVIRVGQSTFALRRAEAGCIKVLPVESAQGRGALEYGVLEGGVA